MTTVVPAVDRLIEGEKMLYSSLFEMLSDTLFVAGGCIARIPEGRDE
jgi:hypothetical protein